MMGELDTLLAEAGATPEQALRMRALSEGIGRAADMGAVSLVPTIRHDLSPEGDSMARASEDEGRRDALPETATGRRLGRYLDLGLLGRGGMGEVRRVLDPTLNRRLAMKIIHADLLTTDAALGRFVEEAQVVAQLQHPNIVPIHALGRLDDGRLFFTMKEVRGRPLSELITAVHEASTDFAWMPTEDGWTFQRLMQVFSQVCAATAFAHSRGVVHRDLKPENILVGRFDEVLVVDWGIARIVEHLRLANHPDAPAIESARLPTQRTRMGEVAGTPAYMAPEQARGQIDRIDARSDIYALGAILYELLSGRCPYGGTTSEQVLSQVILGPPPSVRTTILSSARVTGTIELDFFDLPDEAEDEFPELEGHSEQGARLADELVAACERAMQRRQEARYPNVEALQAVVLDWIDGSRKREKALEIVEHAAELSVEAGALEEKANRLQERSEKAREGLPGWADEKQLAEAWTLEDEGASAALEARLLSTRREQLLLGALTHAADLQDAHAALVEEYRARHAVAEAAGEATRAAEAQLSIEFHKNQLPEEHSTRQDVEAYLEGMGRLSLTTVVPGAAVFCARFEGVNRRLQPGAETLLGHTPLVDHPLPMGSYTLRLVQEGCHEVVYPVRIDRQGHWSGQTPEGTQPPVWLPPLGSLDESECFVPAGPFLVGRDAHVPEGLPAAELWVDDFIIQRFHVTYAEYQQYLQSLSDAGRETELETALPVIDAAASGTSGKSCFVVRDGRVELVEDASGTLPSPEWPIGTVNFRQAVRYAAWRSEVTGQSWRVLDEFEWEKAARGVDARIYPWGNAYTPCWSNAELSREAMSPVDVDSHPVDCSVYGVRGMGGNMSQWTSSAWDPTLTLSGYQRVPPQTPPETEGVMRVFRGGCWMLPEVFTRTSNRIGFQETDGVAHVGFRVGRTIRRP